MMTACWLHSIYTTWSTAWNYHSDLGTQLCNEGWDCKKITVKRWNQIQSCNPAVVFWGRHWDIEANCAKPASLAFQPALFRTSWLSIFFGNPQCYFWSVCEREIMVLALDLTPRCSYVFLKTLIHKNSNPPPLLRMIYELFSLTVAPYMGSAVKFKAHHFSISYDKQ